MKFLRSRYAPLAILAGFIVTALFAQNVLNYRTQGGAHDHIGGNLTIDSGGTLNVASGGAFAIEGTAVTASAAELNAADITAAGTVQASKIVVVDSNKDIGDFRNLDAVNFDAGASGTAGTVDIFPSTATTGKIALTAAANAGDTTTTIVNASQSGARTYTIPDAGESASFVFTEGAQTINDAKTFAGTVNLSGTFQVGGTAITATAAEINETILTLDIADGSADATYFLVSPHAGTISKIWTTIDDVVSTADITITPNIGVTPVTNGLVTIATAASAAGDVDSSTPSAANVLTAGQAMNFVVAGGGAGGAPRIHVAVVITR